MEILSNLAMGFGVALTPFTLFLAVVGCFLGTIIGALPGLGPSNGVAILIPLAFSLGLDATQALVLLTSVYYGTMYGGRISSILLNIPGDEPAMMTTLDGYPMAKQGRAGDALVISGVASFVGAFIATIGLVIIGPLLARIAYKFGPAEYFSLMVLGLIGAIELSNDKARRGRFKDSGRVGTMCRDNCFKNGLIMRACWDTMVLAPPFIITKKEIDELVRLARMALDATYQSVKSEVVSH